MKTINIRLTQEPTPGLFRVVSFCNTTQLSAGQLVDVKTVHNWCGMPRVNVHVLGLTRAETAETQIDLLEAAAPVTALALEPF